MHCRSLNANTMHDHPRHAILHGVVISMPMRIPSVAQS
jgi:hypothetical protein